MIATITDWDYQHFSLWLILIVWFCVAVYWFRMLPVAMKLSVPKTTPVTAAMFAIAIWLVFAYGVLIVEDDHGTSTGRWIRPAVGLYVIAGCYRHWLYMPLVRGVLKLGKEIDRDE